MRTGDSRVLAVRWRSVQALWLRHAVALRRIWKVATTWYLVEPAVALVAVGFGIGRLVQEVDGGMRYAVFVAPGIIMASAMLHAVFECSWAVFYRINDGFYETVLTAPVTVTELALGDVAWAMTRAILATVSVGLVAVAFGWITSPWAVGMLLPAVLVGMVIGALGLIFAALSPNTHTLSLVFTVVATPLYFFSGSFFPIAVLPDALEPVVWLMPLTPGVHIAQGFAWGQLEITHLWSALYMVGLTAVILPVSIYLLKRRMVT
ncbi:MAG: ABC transporter permease [Candidatus Tectomicrobia bacterium]|nr:ABC transporter permease [Candidatus Tectomicrobia bacterium]